MGRHRDSRALPPSAWPDADLSGMGLAPAAGDLTALSLVQLQQNLNVGKNGQAFLDWSQFQYALAIYDRVAAGIAEEKLGAVERSAIDVYARAVLPVQTAMECTDYQARMLLDDAFAARDRLPCCAELLRVGRIDRRRFHKIVTETDLLTDDLEIALADQLIAAEIAGLRGSAGLSEAEAAGIARRHVIEIDPDAERRKRENAKANRTVRSQSLDDGMAQLTVVASAEDIRLAVKTLDAFIAGLCPNDPRTKSAARSDAAIARLLGRGFGCQCDREDCTARFDDAALDTRAARIVVHAICDSTTLDGGDKPGVLDGYGVISGDHVRELADRDDAAVRHHDLNDLCDDEPVDEPDDRDLPGEHDRSGDDAAVHRRPSRPDTPDVCRGDTPCPDRGNGGPAPRPPGDGPAPPAVISRTALPSDPYRPNTLTEVVTRFLWGSCSMPGCERAAFSCDLDHVAEYDNICPEQGGPTCICNLLPKCRFHHLVKTSVEGFVDELWIDPEGIYRWAVTTPEGVTVESVASNQWMFPTLAALRCRHQLEGAVATGVATATDPEALPARARTRTQNKHARRRAERNRNRREREARAAAEQREAERARRAEFEDMGDPPF